MSNISIIDHNFNGNQIKQRQSDGYLDATAMCKATGKRWFNYCQLDSTQAFFSALSSETGYPASELIQSVRGGNPQNQGTWIHPQVAINLAQWCSPQFAVMVSKWVFELITTGKVELHKSSSHRDQTWWNEYHRTFLPTRWQLIVTRVNSLEKSFQRTSLTLLDHEIDKIRDAVGQLEKSLWPLEDLSFRLIES